MDVSEHASSEIYVETLHIHQRVLHPFFIDHRSRSRLGPPTAQSSVREYGTHRSNSLLFKQCDEYGRACSYVETLDIIGNTAVSHCRNILVNSWLYRPLQLHESTPTTTLSQGRSARPSARGPLRTGGRRSALPSARGRGGRSALPSALRGGDRPSPPR